MPSNAIRVPLRKCPGRAARRLPPGERTSDAVRISTPGPAILLRRASRRIATSPALEHHPGLVEAALAQILIADIILAASSL
jgi:hypothetical protein